MQKLVAKLHAHYPAIKFKAGQEFCWSPESSEVIYLPYATGQTAKWSLLHETGHALLKHKSYQADYELIKLEAAAWEEAKKIGSDIGIEIDEDHIQDCLDTYRQWLYKRSICPNCGTKCLQQSDYIHYRCFNCRAVWRVTASRFCRAYRSSKNVAQASVFHLGPDLK